MSTHDYEPVGGERRAAAVPRGIHPLARVGGPPEDLAWRERHERDGDQHYPAVIHPTAWINAYATVDGGTTQPTVVQAGASIFAHAHVGHDAIIEANATITTGAIIGGHARIGAHAKVGLNAVVLPHRTVGEGAEIGALAVVTKDVPAGEVWAGNPARPRPAGKNPVPYTDRR